MAPVESPAVPLRPVYRFELAKLLTQWRIRIVLLACLIAPGGFVAEWPLEGRPSDVLVDGRPVARALPGRVAVPSAPAEILMRGPRS